VPTISGQGEIAVSLHHPWQDRRRRSAPEGATWSPYPGNEACRTRSIDANRFFSHLRTWLRRRTGKPFTGEWVWHAEDGRRSLHLHVFMHLISPNVARRAAARVAAIYPANVIDVRKGSDQRRRHPRRVLGQRARLHDALQVSGMPAGEIQHRREGDSNRWRAMSAQR